MRFHYALTENTHYYLVFENGRFLGSTPMGGNEIFELVLVGDDESVAFRLVNFGEEEDSSSGLGEEPTNITEGASNVTELIEGQANTTNSTEVDTAEQQSDVDVELTDATKASEAPSDATSEPTNSTVKSSECYLGFSNTESAPKCYTSAESAATRFVIIH